MGVSVGCGFLLPPRSQQLLDIFDAHLRRRGRAEGTRRQYGYPLRTFLAWLGEGAVGELTAADIERFLDEWDAAFMQRRGRVPSPAATRGMIVALRVFFAYLEQTEVLVDGNGRLCRNPLRTIEAPSAPQRANDFLRPFEDRALLRADCGHEHRVLVWTLRYTGMRVAEARALSLADIHLAPGEETVAVRISKTRAGVRTIPLLPQLVPLLHEHLDELRARGLRRPTTPFLATRHGTPVTTHHMWRVVKRVAYQAGVRRVPCTCDTRRQDRHASGCPRTRSGDNRSTITPHTLRRTFGSDLINRGLRLETVSKLLGHASTTITERAYAQLLDVTIRTELLDAFQPRDRRS